jgi:hypothetical protein
MSEYNKYIRLLLLQDILTVLGFSCLREAMNSSISKDVLNNEKILKHFMSMVNELKFFYSSDKLTCLHSNFLDKCKNPNISFLRQIIKANNLKLISNNNEVFILNSNHIDLSFTFLTDKIKSNIIYNEQKNKISFDN